MQWFTPTSGFPHSCASIRATTATETSGGPMPGPAVAPRDTAAVRREPLLRTARRTSSSDGRGAAFAPWVKQMQSKSSGRTLAAFSA